MRKAVVVLLSTAGKRYYISANETESWSVERRERERERERDRGNRVKGGQEQREPDWSAINDARAVTIMRRATNTN